MPKQAIRTLIFEPGLYQDVREILPEAIEARNKLDKDVDRVLVISQGVTVEVSKNSTFEALLSEWTDVD